ncbi:nuclear transport factor 2 family protein [Candidatus Pantoea multigeneris]|uniref:Nuclear transport factor 2 family protein n=1 Tax=Candidatus Pantoea multigeneris TaxID=2608357 RepID=A0ABX0RB76_9GAMM|nr:nuclear transport factor 2 family protein [Pantoea multigeneris]NIF21566.1 nuclear transport factor 2 family protein [Pantoea multigeneris]
MNKHITRGLLLVALLTGTHNVFAEKITMSVTTTQAAPVGLQQLIDRHFAIWNNTDAAERAKAFAGVYTPDFFVADPGGLNEGIEQVNATISHVQSQHPGFRFTPAPVEWNHGIARVTWGYGPKKNPVQVRGEDIFTVSHGKLSSARVFLSQ